jgi:hypothetical protein
MASRPEISLVTKKLDTLKKPDTEAVAQEMPSQRKPAEIGTFRLKVDRQTKASYQTLEAAQKAGMAIKKEHPVVQVTVYDSTAGINTTIELPTS